EVGKGQPDGTRLLPFLRLGTDPSPEAGSWGEGVPPDRDYRPAGAAGRRRWAQIKFELTTDRPQSTPSVPPRFDLVFDFVPDRMKDAGKLTVAPADPGQALRFLPPSAPFTYQEPSPRLQRLRERHQLEQV